MGWINHSLSALLNPLAMGGTPRVVGTVAGYGAQAVFSGSVFAMRGVGLIRMESDAEIKSDRAKVLREEAVRRGIPFASARLLGRETSAYEVRVAGKRILFVGLPRPITTPSNADWWLDDKAVLKERLLAAGIPAPRGGCFTGFAPLLEAFGSLRKPVIVKPRIGSRGRHTTTNISSVEDLRTAFRVAKQLCHWVILEEHLEGSVYRGTMIDGKLAGVLRGDPPRVVGDGVHTIEELVVLKNASRHPLVHEVVLTDTHRAFLARQNYVVTDVPPKGAMIDLLEKIGVSYGGHSAEVTAVTHPETKRILVEAARVVDDPLIGFDFIIPDIEKSPHEQRWGIIECNSAPFINLHHDPVEGVPVNVAGAVWDYVEKNIERY